MADAPGRGEEPRRGADIARQAEENLKESRQVLRLLEEALRRGRAVLGDPAGGPGDEDPDPTGEDETGESPEP